MTSTSSNSETVTDEHLKHSLISSIADKVNRKLAERIASNSVEVQSLSMSYAELDQGRTQLNDLITRLLQDEDRCTAFLTQLRVANRQLLEAAERLRTNELIPADDILAPTAPLFRQCVLTSFAFLFFRIIHQLTVLLFV